jgi:drug/metabolite transporter (DMT)-like permease
MKALGDVIPLMQAITLRGLGASLFLVVLTWGMGQFVWRLPRREWTLLSIRALAETGGAWTFLTALNHMPIADVSAILQSLPLTITLAGALILGEAVGWRRMVAILIGFGGVLLIVRPTGEGFTIYAVYVLLCVVCVTVRDLVSRRLHPATPSLMAAVTSAIGVTFFALIGSAFVDWQPLNWETGGQLAGSMLFLMGGLIFSVLSVRVGDIGFVAPFRYTSLLVAILVGIFVFDTVPDLLTWVGAAIVVATGLFTLYRERQLRLARVARAAALGSV